MIVYDKVINLKAFRNIRGVEICKVDELSVLQLCPGGHPGRLVIWMKDVFFKLHDLFGGFENESNLKNKFILSNGMTTNDDVEKIFFSDEIEAFIDESCLIEKPRLVKDVKEVEKLNPYLRLAN